MSAAEDTTLNSVFAVCPHLQSLSHWYLTRENATTPGHCPQSLSELWLSTNDLDCGLIAVYEAYKDSKALKDTSLHCNMVGRAEDFGNTLHGAVDLGVKLLRGGLISITVLFAGGRRLTVSWPLDYEYADAEGRTDPPFFAQAAPCFDQLQKVRLPLGVLPFFILDVPHLPALEELRVDVAPGMDHLGQPQELEWSELTRLREFAASRSDFRLVLDVSHPHGPTADDARSLLACLAGCAAHLAITATGFAADAIPDDIPREPNVMFVPDA